MELEMLTILAAGLITGLISLGTSIALFNRFRKERLNGTLILALYVLFYALANFLWVTEDSFLVGNFQIATLAYIFECIPAYLGVVFSVVMVKLREKIIIPTASAIIGAAIISFVLFPLKYEIVGAGYVYQPALITKGILVVVAVMALTPVVVFLIYSKEMKKLGNLKERNKGITLATGFLLMILGENVLLTLLKVPLLLPLIISLAGIVILYCGLTAGKKMG